MYSSKKIYDEILKKLSLIYEAVEASQLTRMLLEEHLEISFEQILIDEQIQYDAESRISLDDNVSQLMDYVPIQYVLGKAQFYGREFIVNQNVLIPRQETEELINEIIIDNKRPELSVLDIGTGSGCIGITLAMEMKRPILTALEIDGAAIEIAKENADRYDVRMEFVQSDILQTENLPEMYDIIVSNPPYVTESEKSIMHQNVLKFEPHNALFVPNEDPLIFYRKIIELGRNHLNKDGKLYFEVNERFGNQLVALLGENGYASSRLIQDLNGKNRILKARIN